MSATHELSMLNELNRRSLTVELTMKDDSKYLILRDQDGNWLHVKRVGNFLRFTLECDTGITSFDASATHVGKILELVVDQFFPGGAGDSGTKDS